MPKLSKLAQETAKSGVVVIGVTDEKPEVVVDWYAQRKPKHPIVILEDGKFEDALGVSRFPTVGILDPSGQLVWTGHFGYESELKKAAAEALRAPLYPKSIDKVVGYVGSGEMGKAWTELSKLKDKADEEVGPWAERMEKEVLGMAKRDFAATRKDAQAGLVWQARTRLEPYLDSKEPYPDAGAYQVLLADLEARPDYKDELKASQKYSKAKALDKEREYSDAAKAYASLAKKYGELQVGQLALADAKRLIEAGMPGYRSSCLKCRKARRACAKHDDSGKIKLP